MHDTDYLAFASDAVRAQIGVDRRTWMRWRRGQSRIPAAALVLLRMLVQGELPQGGEDWTGWRFHDGKLYSDLGDSYTPAELRALPMLYARLADAKLEIKRLRSAALAEPPRLGARG
jgi:hypothetical protein